MPGMRPAASALTLGLLFAGILSGCALFETHAKCGFRGCPGDAQITAQVLSQFRERSDLEPNAISVQTLDHTVYLSGLVSSSLEISTAESIARQVPGVKGVVNSVVAMTR
jgi:osmotically-inducible protein OsmY